MNSNDMRKFAKHFEPRVQSKTKFDQIVKWLQDFFVPPYEPLGAEATNSAVLAQSRERIVVGLLRIITLLGVPAVAVGIPVLVRDGHWLQLTIGTVAIVIIAYLGWVKQASYELRASSLVVAAYLFLLSWASAGLDEFFLAALFAFVIMATLLLGRKAGIISFIMSLGMLFWFNWQLDAGRLDFQMMLVPFDSPLLFRLQPYVDWGFYIGIVSLTLLIFLGDFETAWARERAATREAKEEKERLAEALAWEHELLQELQRLYERETELSRLKSRIITTVSHEFRTPLTVINSSADLLFRYGDRLTGEKRERSRARLHEAVLYLVDLIQDLEMVDTVQNDGVTAQPVHQPFNALCCRLRHELFAEIGDLPNLLFRFDEEDRRPLLIDVDLFQPILSNLVTNALKYGGDWEAIAVDLELVDDFLVLRVTDRGIGLVPGEEERIFDMFYRGENVETRRGLGLGLYTVKSLAHTLGGTVAACSDGPGRGTIFTVRLPVS